MQAKKERGEPCLWKIGLNLGLHEIVHCTIFLLRCNKNIVSMKPSYVFEHYPSIPGSNLQVGERYEPAD